MLPYSCPPYSGLAVPAWSVTSRLMLHLPVTLHAQEGIKETLLQFSWRESRLLTLQDNRKTVSCSLSRQPFSYPPF